MEKIKINNQQRDYNKKPIIIDNNNIVPRLVYYFQIKKAKRKIIENKIVNEQNIMISIFRRVA